MSKMPISMLLRRSSEIADERCCTDERAITTRPAATAGWARKLKSAVPASLAAFRGTLRAPVDSPGVGSRVVTEGGTQLGRVKDVVVGLETGRTSYEVSPGRTAPGESPAILVPGDSLREGAEEDVFVADLDEDRLVRIA